MNKSDNFKVIVICLSIATTIIVALTCFSYLQQTGTMKNAIVSPQRKTTYETYFV